MSLRIQLLGLGLLTLTLPWAGYRYVQELEGALRSGLEQSLLASASTISAALDSQSLPALTGRDRWNDVENTIYAHPLATRPGLDGYLSDWSSAQIPGAALGDVAWYRAGVHERSVYLFLSVTDPTLVYQSAPMQTPYGDRVLILPGGRDENWLLLHTAAPGAVPSQLTYSPSFAPSGDQEDRVLAYWRETGEGYTVEVRLPLDLVNDRLGLALVDVDPPADPGQPYEVTLHGTWAIGREAPGIFVYRPPTLGIAAKQFEQPGLRLRVADASGWVLFDGGAVDPVPGAASAMPLSLSERFYRFILRRGDPPYQDLESPPGRLADTTLRSALDGQPVAAWYTRGTDASAVVTAAVPIGPSGTIQGAVVLEQGSDAILTLTNAALVRLMSFTLLTSLVVAVGLLSYATVLSFRVRRLARAADTALSPEGEIRSSLPGRGAGDEIGDLARSFTDLLNRLSDYTQYLRTLKAKLAHELRTPLAVVSTSLDNLEREPHSPNLSPYLARLREGAARLDAILSAMSEATLMEQAIADTRPEIFDLDTVLASCLDAYRDVYTERDFSYEVSAAQTSVLGSAELIAQMMDKLVDNAVSFSPPDSTIGVALGSNEKELSLAISNQGPRLPDTMRTQLFDSLVSMRAAEDQREHLGMGLYIVALIVDFHRGRVGAKDLPDDSGVVVEVVLPVAKSANAA